MPYFVLSAEQYRQTAIAYISRLPLDAGLCLEVKKHKRDRSGAQNRLWHKWVGIMAKEAGYHVEEMKDILKRHILGSVEYENKRTGEVYQRVRSTTELSVKEFSELMNQTEILAAQYGIVLPHPADFEIAHGNRG